MVCFAPPLQAFSGSRSNTMHTLVSSGAAFPDDSSTRTARKYGVNVIDAASNGGQHRRCFEFAGFGAGYCATLST
jgi:hypothetical protein